MSSIFRTSHKDLDWRVNANSSQGNTAPKQQRETFASIMQNLSAEPEKSLTSKQLPEFAQVPHHTLVANRNTSSSQSEYWNSMLTLCPEPDLSNAEVHSKSNDDQLLCLSDGVSSSPISVKIETAQQEPSVPVLASIQRIKPVSDSRDNLSRDEITQLIKKTGRSFGVDPYLSLAVAQSESSLTADALSSDGHYSKGLFQLLDSTAQDMLERLNVSERYEPFSPGMNTHLGVGYLRRLHDIFSSPTSIGAGLQTIPARTAADLEKLAVAAYNTGEGNVTEAQHRARRLGKDPGLYSSVEPHLSPITQAYVKRVTEYRREFARGEGTKDPVT